MTSLPPVLPRTGTKAPSAGPSQDQGTRSSAVPAVLPRIGAERAVESDAEKAHASLGLLDALPEEIQRNFEALNKKYEEERDRRLNKRPQQLDGQSNYVRLADLAANDPRFQYMIDDPWIEDKWRNRAPVSDDIEVAIIGGGFGGLLSAGVAAASRSFCTTISC